MSRRRFHYSNTALSMEPIVRLWVLRILVKLGGYREIMSNHGITEDELARALGLTHWIDIDPAKYSIKNVRKDLDALLLQAEESENETAPLGCLRQNMNLMAELIGLNTIDCRILEFATLLNIEHTLEHVTDFLGTLTSGKAHLALSVILGLPEEGVRASLHPQSLLGRSGLLSSRRSGSETLGNKLNLISNEFADRMASAIADPIHLLRDAISPVEPGDLNLSDYQHIQPSLDILFPYLKHSSSNHKQGVNIFLHGAPGTGKSQLARVLAAAMGCELFEISSEDSDGDPIKSEQRLRAFRAAQSVFSQRQALIVNRPGFCGGSII